MIDGNRRGLVMPVQTMTLEVPEEIYHRLEQRAQKTKRTVEAEVLDVLAAAVPASDQLSADLTEAISSLVLLDDEALWRAARSRLSVEVSEQLEELRLRQNIDGLTEAERQCLSNLTGQYERNMLIRAQAAALLHQRGRDVIG
jgi:plasmid stability protein